MRRQNSFPTSFPSNSARAADALASLTMHNEENEILRMARAVIKSVFGLGSGSPTCPFNGRALDSIFIDRRRSALKQNKQFMRLCLFSRIRTHAPGFVFLVRFSGIFVLMQVARCQKRNRQGRAMLSHLPALANLNSSARSECWFSTFYGRHG
jgi:hypothetical protein